MMYDNIRWPKAQTDKFTHLSEVYPNKYGTKKETNR